MFFRVKFKSKIVKELACALRIKVFESNYTRLDVARVKNVHITRVPSRSDKSYLFVKNVLVRTIIMYVKNVMRVTSKHGT